MPPRGAPVAAGDLIDGRYLVESPLGSGGMAVVYRARHTGTGVMCALKLVHPHLVARSELRALFLREARVGGRIGKSPHVVDVLDAGFDLERGAALPGHGAASRARRSRTSCAREGALPPALVRPCSSQIADALDQAHGAGVVHRDLKPGNLFLVLGRRGQPCVKVMDFGIAKVLEAGAHHTATQIGTPAYAAPEQMGPSMRAAAARQGITVAASVSPATDVWALGLLAYELCTGLPAVQFWGAEASAEVPIKAVLFPHDAASSRAGERADKLPPGFDAWFARATHVDASCRWPAAGLAVAELLGLFEAAPPPLRRRRPDAGSKDGPTGPGLTELPAGTPAPLAGPAPGRPPPPSAPGPGRHASSCELRRLLAADGPRGQLCCRGAEELLQRGARRLRAPRRRRPGGRGGRRLPRAAPGATGAPACRTAGERCAEACGAGDASSCGRLRGRVTSAARASRATKLAPPRSTRGVRRRRRLRLRGAGPSPPARPRRPRPRSGAGARALREGVRRGPTADGGVGGQDAARVRLARGGLPRRDGGRRPRRRAGPLALPRRVRARGRHRLQGSRRHAPVRPRRARPRRGRGRRPLPRGLRRAASCWAATISACWWAQGAAAWPRTGASRPTSTAAPATAATMLGCDNLAWMIEHGKRRASHADPPRAGGALPASVRPGRRARLRQPRRHDRESGSAGLHRPDPVRVPRDSTRQAMREHGDAHPCDNLGAMVEHGKGGLAADFGGASGLYQRACDGGDMDGCNT